MKKYNVFLCLGVYFILLNVAIGDPSYLPDSHLEILVNNSEFILIGEVKSILEIINIPGYIPTYEIKITCKILEFLKGDMSENEISILGRITNEPPRVGAKGIFFLGKYLRESRYIMLTNISDANNEFLSKIKKYIHEGSRLNKH